VAAVGSITIQKPGNILYHGVTGSALEGSSTISPNVAYQVYFLPVR
jgi:hypothetical protein